MERPADFVSLTAIATAHNKKLNNFTRSKAAQRFLNALAKRLKVQNPSLVVHKYAAGGKHTTWGHPIVAEEVHRWCQQNSEERSRSGFVYTVTSPLVKVVKIGCWGGSLDGLRKRYATCYGPDLQVEKAFVSDRLAAEAKMHPQFAAYNCGGELFEKAYLREYVAALQAL